MTSKELSNFVFTSKYARWLPEKKRRETWKEATERVKNMMLEKYKNCGIEEEINFAYDMMQKKKVLGSQRTLQFAGDAVLRHSARSFNCSFSYVDRLRVFQESFYVLLCGCGVGFSVQSHHVDKLPKLIGELPTETKTYVVADNIEGWADSVGILMNSFMKDSAYSSYHNYKVEFDYSQIRPKGSPLSSSSAGKAPGPDPLRRCHEKITELLTNLISSGQEKLKPINAHDILCHVADAVISGGIRRAAMISLFSKDNKEMMEAKIGNWFADNPQRARCNNSAILLRDNTTQEEFREIFKYTREFGEPGFYWVNNLEHGANPCFYKETRILTRHGYQKITDMNFDSDNIVMIDNRLVDNTIGVSETVGSHVKLTQKNVDLYETKFDNGQSLITTKEHGFILSNSQRIEQKNLNVGDKVFIQSSEGRFGKVGTYNQGLILGLITGDGTFDKNGKEAFIDIWPNDYDMSDKIQEIVNVETQEIKSNHHLREEYPILGWQDNNIRKRIGGRRLYRFLQEVLGINNPLDIKDSVPDCVFNGNKEFVRGYIQGLFFSDGTISPANHKAKPTFSTRINQSNKKILEEVLILLANFGISGKIYLRKKEGKRLMPDGKGGKKEYFCKNNYEIILNRNNSIDMYDKIGIFGRKLDIYRNLPIEVLTKGRKAEKYICTVKEIRYFGKDDVYCLNVPNTNSVIANGIVVGQCGEIGLYAYDQAGNSGFSFCNLCTINIGNVEDEQDFFDRCRAAAIMGTLQAGFDSFPYLGEVTENIVKGEALLGVSLSGMMQKDEIAFCPKIQRKGVKIINKVNEELSQKIGINRAARLTCIKPDGNSASVLGVSSGIHPNHAKRYIRRVQNNESDIIYKYFKKINPQATEKSVWDASGTDENILFPIEVPDGSKLKNMISAIQMLEMVKTTYENWIKPGTNEEFCATPGITHNVSNTVTVLDTEWEDVAKYVYKNRNSLGGVSFLSDKGDKDYPQAPYTTIYTSRELVKEYGEAAVWCSGLIELGLQAFNNNLWAACDFILSCSKNGMKNSLTNNNDTNVENLESLANEFSLASLKVNLYRKVVRFAKNYFDGDILRLTYCLKDVANYKLYYDIRNSMKSVDYTQMVEDNDNTNFEQESACSGGACLV
jgi:hypothetical protein